jgi:type III secretion protein W
MIERLGLNHDAVSLLQRQLGYADSGIDEPEILRFGQDLGNGTSTRQVVLLNALYPMTRDLPLDLWSDSRVRDKALGSFLVVLDELRRGEQGPGKFDGDLGAFA